MHQFLSWILDAPDDTLYAHNRRKTAIKQRAINKNQ